MTIDEDVAQQIRQIMRERGTGFKETVNELLRRGLRPSAPAAPYETPTFASGVVEGVELDKALGRRRPRGRRDRPEVRDGQVNSSI